MQRILVIEDIEDLVIEIVEILELNGYEAMAALGGLDGLRLAREYLPDLIICDIMMPEIDGYEVLSELRNDSLTAPIPFIFLTARASPPDIRKGMELGADDYLIKPFDEGQLLAAVKSRINKRTNIETTQMRALSRKFVSQREIEQRALAQALQANITQPLAGLKLSMHGAAQLPPRKLEQKLAEVQNLANQILAQVTAVVNTIWPVGLDELGLLPSLLQYFEQFYADTQIAVNFSHLGLEKSFSKEVKITVYRVIEQVLWNAARYANVREVRVAVWAEDNVLNVDVEDQGVGFDIEQVFAAGATSGLIQIQERVLTVGGELGIQSAPGAGVHVSAKIPFTEVEENEQLLPDIQTPLSRIASRLSNNQTTRILIALENQIIREGIKYLLDSETDFQVIDEVAQRDEILHAVNNLQPDLLILEITMSGVSNLNLVRPAMASKTDMRILIFSNHSSEVYAYEALRSGAAGYVRHSIQSDDLIEAVRVVAQGKNYWDTPFDEEAIDTHLNAYKVGDPESDLYDALTSREREILTMVANGSTSKQIAGMLSISPRTAETHRNNIARKLGLRTQADLIHYAIKHGHVQS